MHLCPCKVIPTDGAYRNYSGRQNMTTFYSSTKNLLTLKYKQFTFIILICFCLPLLLLSSSEELPFPPPASDELLVLLHPPYELAKHDTVLDSVDHQCACKTISSSSMKTMEVKQLNINISFRNRSTVLINFCCSLFILPWKTYCASFFQLDFSPFEDNKTMQIV